MCPPGSDEWIIDVQVDPFLDGGVGAPQIADDGVVSVTASFDVQHRPGAYAETVVITGKWAASLYYTDPIDVSIDAGEQVPYVTAIIDIPQDAYINWPAGRDTASQSWTYFCD